MLKKLFPKNLLPNSGCGLSTDAAYRRVNTVSNTLNGLHSFRIRVFFVEFDTLHLEIFVICWIESVYPVDDLRMTNQIYLFIVMSQYTNSHAETPFGISSIYVILTISYLRAQTIETSSLPTDSSRPLFKQIEIFSIYRLHICTVSTVLNIRASY